MKAAAKRDVYVPSSILVHRVIENVAADQLHLLVAKLPKRPSMERLVRCKRRPADAKDLDKDPSDVIWQPESRVLDDGRCFLLIDSRDLSNAGSIFFIFASDHCISQLKISKRWAVDGTFYSAPDWFTQLYSINAFIGDSTVPCVNFLLQDKKEDTYRRAFNALVDVIGRDINPKAIIAGKCQYVYYIKPLLQHQLPYLTCCYISI